MFGHCIWKDHKYSDKISSCGSHIHSSSVLPWHRVTHVEIQTKWEIFFIWHFETRSLKQEVAWFIVQQICNPVLKWRKIGIGLGNYWHRSGNKYLQEWMMTKSTYKYCAISPKWVNLKYYKKYKFPQPGYAFRLDMHGISQLLWHTQEASPTKTWTYQRYAWRYRINCPDLTLYFHLRS